MTDALIERYVQHVCDENGWPKTFVWAGYNRICLESRGRQHNFALDPMSNWLVQLRKGVTDLHSEAAK